MNSVLNRKTHIQQMSKLGVKEGIYAPLFFKLMWKCGIEISPPLLLGGGQNFLITFVVFSILHWLAIAAVVPFFENVSWNYIATITYLLAGTIISLFQAIWYRNYSKKCGIQREK